MKLVGRLKKESNAREGRGDKKGPEDGRDLEIERAEK